MKGLHAISRETKWLLRMTGTIEWLYPSQVGLGFISLCSVAQWKTQNSMPSGHLQVLMRYTISMFLSRLSYHPCSQVNKWSCSGLSIPTGESSQCQVSWVNESLDCICHVSPIFYASHSTQQTECGGHDLCHLVDPATNYIKNRAYGERNMGVAAGCLPYLTVLLWGVSPDDRISPDPLHIIIIIKIVITLLKHSTRQHDGTQICQERVFEL